jgi:peptidoglycan/xylan/chitin deacetylase (PgdA/CDA1 family)
MLHEGEDLHGVCALTFDDGTEDIATTVEPILEELGAEGTVYVCPGLFGRPYPWCDRAAGVRLMSASEVTRLARGGILEVGAHTIEHTVLAEASAADAYEEMSACKLRLEELIGSEVPSFCYPRCVYSEPCPAAARRAGYTSAVTCGPRGSWDPFELKRESIHTPDGPLTFALKSRGLYYGIRDLPPARLVRSLTRPYRHRAER